MPKRVPDLPPEDGDAPLQELSHDALSVFLFLCFTGKELLDLIRELKLTVPGYRLEGLSDAERADVLADEIRAAPKARRPVIAKLREIYQFPALDAVSLVPEVAREIAGAACDPGALVLFLWRVLADPDPAVRAAAKPALDLLVRDYYGDGKAPAAEAGAGIKPRTGAPKPGVGGGRDAEAAARERARLEKELDAAAREAKRAKEREDDARTELDAFRADVAKADKAIAQLKSESEALSRKLAKSEEALAEEKKKSASGELGRARREYEDRIHGLETRVRALEKEKTALADEADALRAKAVAAAPPGPARAAAPAATEGEGAATEALPASWMLPRFTREFYDSLDGWEPRIQRIAFKQAMLLAENHRHPSLRAIPLEGLPGYFRVRVATDVRLIYRRADRDVEILSVIDREDLDRYVRQAKTR